jgi:hypothetical protein
MIQAFPESPEFLDAARRIIWFEPPEQVLKHPLRLMTDALRYATAADMRLLLDHVGDDGLRETLDTAAPGIIDPRSWSYWNVMIGRYPAPPMPQRQLPPDVSAQCNRLP